MVTTDFVKYSRSRQARPNLSPDISWLEQSTHNRLVVGSSPTGPTIIFIDMAAHR